MRIEIYSPKALNEIGKRDNNEDSIYPSKGQDSNSSNIFIVCDGMGGHEKGEVASKIVAQTFGEDYQDNKGYVDQWNIAITFNKAQNRIQEFINSHPEAKGMGTTLSLLYINKKDVVIAHCGDSRVYQVRDGEVIFKTEDHSLVNELFRSGIINEEEAKNHPKKNVITRAMQGASTPVKADVKTLTDVHPDDFFFLCSDGVTESFDDLQLANLFKENNPEKIIQEINKTCFEHSKDNYSCYLLKVAKAPNGAGNIAASTNKIVKPKPSSKSKLFILIVLISSLVLNIALGIILAFTVIEKNKLIAENEAIINDVKNWVEIESNETVEAYEIYMKNFPKGLFYEIADKKIKDIYLLKQQKSIWEQTKTYDSDSAYQIYIDTYPDGKYFELAQMKLKLLEHEKRLMNDQINLDSINYKTVFMKYVEKKMMKLEKMNEMSNQMVVIE